MYPNCPLYVHMVRRVTIELDKELLARAKKALRQPTMRATVEEALRRATESAEKESEERRQRQLEYFETLGEHCDLEVMKSEKNFSGLYLSVQLGSLNNFTPPNRRVNMMHTKHSFARTSISLTHQ